MSRWVLATSLHGSEDMRTTYCKETHHYFVFPKRCSPRNDALVVLSLGVNRLEPIPKLFEEHRDAGELHQSQEGGGIVLPPNE